MSEYVDQAEFSGYVDPDYEGTQRLLGKLYGGRLLQDRDPDLFIYPALQTIKDTAGGMIPTADVEHRFLLYHNARKGLNGDETVINDYKDMLEGYPGNLDDAAMYAIRKDAYIYYRAFFSGLRYTSVLLNMDDDFVSKYADYPDERFRADHQLAHAYFTTVAAMDLSKGHAEVNWYEDLIWQCEIHGADRLQFFSDGLNRNYAVEQFPLKDIKAVVEEMNRTDEIIRGMIKRGLEGEDLFPAIMAYYYGGFAKCTLKDGSVLRGTVIDAGLMEEEWNGTFYLETETGRVLMHAEDIRRMMPIKTLKVRVRKPQKA